jgi:broad specificity phosphatase PhoE
VKPALGAAGTALAGWASSEAESRRTAVHRAAKRIVLVRHGQAAVRGELLGRLDPPLTAEGRAQIEALRVELPNLLGGRPLRLACTSPLLRARQTAEILLFGGAGRRRETGLAVRAASTSGRQETAPGVSEKGEARQSEVQGVGSPLAKGDASVFGESDAAARDAFEPKGACESEEAFEPEIEPDFVEISLGDWEGLTKRRVLADWPELWAARGRDLVHAAPPGGENFAQVAARVLPAWEKIVRRLGDGEAALVTAHQAVNRVILAQERGWPLLEVLSIDVPLGSAAVIERV